MGFCVYILHSDSLGRFYSGFTERGTRRIAEHRSKQHGWTGQASDWVEKYSCHVETRAEARALEMAIKSRGAKRYLEDHSTAV